jgi:hypothetical protein
MTANNEFLEEQKKTNALLKQLCENTAYICTELAAVKELLVRRLS